MGERGRLPNVVARIGVQARAPEPPKRLDKDARRLFNECARRLTDVGVVLDELDAEALAEWAELSVTVHRLSAQIAREGITVGGARGIPKVNPAVDARSKLQRQILQLADRLGLSPRARARLRIELRPSTLRDTPETRGPGGKPSIRRTDD